MGVFNIKKWMFNPVGLINFKIIKGILKGFMYFYRSLRTEGGE